MDVCARTPTSGYVEIEPGRFSSHDRGRSARRHRWFQPPVQGGPRERYRRPPNGVA